MQPLSLLCRHIAALGLVLLGSTSQALGNEGALSESDAQPMLPSEYHLSCITEVAVPLILTAPDETKTIEREIGFDRAFSFNPDRIIRENGVQFLSGYLINQRARLVATNVEREETDRYRLFVLSSEWECGLYRGNRPKGPVTGSTFRD